jgi:hypothetical protein
MLNTSLYRANVIDLLDIASLPLEQKHEIVETATELVETRALVSILSLLEDDQKKNFAEAVREEDMEALNKLFEENGVDYLSIIEVELERVKADLLELKKSV